MKTVSQVDLERFMGDWYVIAHIPISMESEAYNAVESYHLDPDGTVATTFSFNDGGFDGKRKVYTPRGFVGDDGSNALWGMRFVWPFKADYRIVYLDDGYETVVIGRQKRDYVWIMARQPAVPAAKYESIVDFVESIGYDVSALRLVPHRAAETDAADRG